jgi:hypothetical protein
MAAGATFNFIVLAVHYASALLVPVASANAKGKAQRAVAETRSRDNKARVNTKQKEPREHSTLSSLRLALCPLLVTVVPSYTFLCKAIASGLSGSMLIALAAYFSGLAHVAALQKNSAQQNVRVNQS